MDSELREYLDRRFEENRQHLERHVDARFEENRQHLERHVDARSEENRQHLERHVDARSEEDRQHLERHVDARFEETQGQLAEFRRAADVRFEKVGGQIRQTHVVIEEVRGLVETVAEGVVAVREAQQEINRELKGDIGEVRDLLTASYRHLDQRLRVIEGV